MSNLFFVAPKDLLEVPLLIKEENNPPASKFCFFCYEPKFLLKTLLADLDDETPLYLLIIIL